MEKRMYTITTDLPYTATKSEIKEFAETHGCTISNFTINGPAGGNHLVTFQSNNLDHIQELTDQLLLPLEKIMEV